MKILGRTGRQVQYNGTHGNLSVAALSVALAAAQIGDVIILGEFDSTIRVEDFRVDHDNLGASTSLKLGFAYIGDPASDTPDAIATGLTTTAAGSKRMAGMPVESVNHCQLTATVVGGVATGDVNVTVFYSNHS
jgi:hypothetical protein